MTNRLENAQNLYLEGIRDGKAREAITQYAGARYTQHSTGVKDGVEGFIEFFEPFIARNPKRDIQIIRGLEDGRYVFLHVYQSLNDGEAQWLTTDFFDTDEDGKNYRTLGCDLSVRTPNSLWPYLYRRHYRDQ